jgi:hypothetical protein
MTRAVVRARRRERMSPPAPLTASEVVICDQMRIADPDCLQPVRGRGRCRIGDDCEGMTKGNQGGLPEPAKGRQSRFFCIRHLPLAQLRRGAQPAPHSLGTRSRFGRWERRGDRFPVEAKGTPFESDANANWVGYRRTGLHSALRSLCPSSACTRVPAPLQPSDGSPRVR